MTTRNEIHMTVQDASGHAIVLDRLVRPEYVSKLVDQAIDENEGDLTVTLSVRRFQGEPFRRVAA